MCVDRFRSGFRYALRWLPCIKWSASDAHGFWGFMSNRNASVGADLTRCSYALVGGAAGMSLVDRGRNGGGGGGGTSQRQRRPSVDTSGKAGRRSQMSSKRRSSGTPGVAEFHYKYSNGRFDSY